MPAAGTEETGCRLWLHWFVRFMKGLTVLSLLASIAAYIIIIDFSMKSDLNAVDKAFTLLGNTGFITLAVFLIIAEFEPAWFIKHVVIMHYWAARGFWNIWMGIQTISTSKQLSAAIGDNPDVDKGLLEDFGVAVGAVLMICGVIFCCFTLACVKSFSDDPEDLVQPLAGSEEAILAANLALALGMTPAEAKKKFAKGDRGAREAQKLAKERTEEIAKLKTQVDQAKKMAGAASKGAQRAAADTYGSVQTAAASAAAAPSRSARATPPADDSAYAPPGAADADDDDRPKRGGGGDEDELMRAYYANAKFDH